MAHEENTRNVQAQDPQPEIAPKSCESGVAPSAGKKKKLSLDIEEIGEVLERKISP